MLTAALLVMLSTDGGAAIPFDGTLVPGQRYELRGPGATVLEALRPPRLKVPAHHAARVEWREVPTLPAGEVRLIFEVETHEVVRVSERRWNSTWTCRVVEVRVE